MANLSYNCCDTSTNTKLNTFKVLILLFCQVELSGQPIKQCVWHFCSDLGSVMLKFSLHICFLCEQPSAFSTFQKFYQVWTKVQNLVFESLTLLLCVWLFLSVSAIDFRPYKRTDKYFALQHLTAKSCVFFILFFPQVPSVRKYPLQIYLHY